MQTSRSIPCGGTTSRAAPAIPPSPSRCPARQGMAPLTNMAAPAPPRHLPGPKMAPAAAAVSGAAPRWRHSAPRCQYSIWLHSLHRRGPRLARPRRRRQAVSALIKDGGGQRRWSLGSRRSLLAGLRGRHGGGRAGVRVRSLREARCQRLPHPAAHLQPWLQVRERAAPAIAPARPGLPRALPAGRPGAGLCRARGPASSLGKAVSCGRERVWLSPEPPPAELRRSRRLELPLVAGGQRLKAGEPPLRAVGEQGLLCSSAAGGEGQLGVPGRAPGCSRFAGIPEMGLMCYNGTLDLVWWL